MLIELMESFNLLPVEVNKVSGTSLLWRNRASNDDLPDSEFVERYSWVVKNNFFSDNTRILNSATQIMYAERYGGFGLGANGGGARVVNFNGVQIKGIGANALAGEGSLMSHSYGGLDIQGAVKEIIYSRLLSKISPVGVQNIKGLILLDDTSALHNGNRAPSVLMIRDIVLRPGHLLPCTNFRIKPELNGLLRSDYSRILSIYKNIGQQGLLSEFYTLIQNFLDKCADQLSFFKMARLCHSALSPSNLCLDGRVLDTALCSFVVSGNNYGQVTSYFDEPRIPGVIAKEWFYLIQKFLKEESVEDHFLKLYEEKFYQYASVNVGFIFGLDREMSTKLSSNPEWQKVASRLISLFSIGSPTKTTVLPVVDAVDFVNDVLTASLFSILNGCEVNKSNKFLSEFSTDLGALMVSMATSLGWYGQSERGFYKLFAIQAIKRAILSSYFFITYIGFTVDENYESGRIDNTAKLIEENDQVMDWIYENLLSERCTIFSGNGIMIEYSSLADKYLYRDSTGVEVLIDRVGDLKSIIQKNKDDYVIQNYDFYPYLSRLLALLNGEAASSFNGVKNVFC